jgi:hypothetical protein
VVFAIACSYSTNYASGVNTVILPLSRASPYTLTSNYYTW